MNRVYKVVPSPDGKWQVEGPSDTIYVPTEEQARDFAYVMNQAFAAGFAAKVVS
jgi:hypothetical protein